MLCESLIKAVIAGLTRNLPNDIAVLSYFALMEQIAAQSRSDRNF